MKKETLRFTLPLLDEILAAIINRVSEMVLLGYGCTDIKWLKSDSDIVVELTFESGT